MPVGDRQLAQDDWRVQMYCRDLERTFHQIERVCYEHEAELWDLWREPSSGRTNIPPIDDEHCILKIFRRDAGEEFPNNSGDLYMRFRSVAQNLAHDLLPHFEQRHHPPYRTEIPEHLYLRYTPDRVVDHPLGANHLDLNMQTLIQSQWVTYAAMDGRPQQQVLRITGWEIRGIHWFTRAVTGMRYSKYEGRLRWIDSDALVDIREVNYNHVRRADDNYPSMRLEYDASSSCNIY